MRLLNELSDVTTIDCLDHLYEAGRGEFGEMITGNIYHIIAETPHGIRFQNVISFSTQVEMGGEEGWCPYQSNAKAGEQADDYINYIQRFVDKGGKLDPKHWYRVQGSYCSPGYDEMAEKEWELQMENQR